MPTNRHPGPNATRHDAKQPTMAQYVTALIGADKLISPAVMPIKRKKETVPRKVYDRAEDRLRPLIVKHLRKNKCKVWRIEPSSKGKFGLGDLWVFCCKDGNYCCGWAEIKTPIGTLSEDQKEFKSWCETFGINYWVIRSIEDCDKILCPSPTKNALL